MRRILFLLLIFSLNTRIAFAQVSNDYCVNAINLGVLPTPNSCSAATNPGVGASLNFNFTNVGATPGNPYTSVIGCNSTISSDVWFRTTLTGGQLVVPVTGAFTNGVKITIYQDDCSNLTAWGCSSGPSPHTYTCNNIMNGNTVLIQISGIGVADQAPFSLTIANNDDCNVCNLGYNLVANPAPVNGTYLPNQTVNFCYSVNQWRMVGVNWLHGVQVQFGDGWDQSTLVTYPVTSKDGMGTWQWFPSDSSYQTSLEFGAGYYYQSVLGDIDPSLPDTVSGDNWGDYASGIIAPPWVFCWDVTTSGSLDTSLIDLSVIVSTTADGESGSWVNFGCANDPSAFSSATLVFCGFPTVSVLPSCAEDSTGNATAMGQGIAPFDYLWTNTQGDTLLLDTANFGSSNLTQNPVGVYTVEVTDSTGCTQIVDLFIDPIKESYFTYPDSMYCYIGVNPIPDSIYLTGGTFSATPSSLTIDANTGEIDITTALPDSTYYIMYVTNFSCGLDTSIFKLIITDTVLNAYFSYADTTFCANSISQLPDSVTNNNFDIFFATDPLVIIDPNSGEITITPLMANNTFTVYHTTNFGCRDTASFTFTVLPTDIPYFTYPVDSVCSGDPIVFPDSITYPGGTFTMLTTLVQIDTITGAIDLSNTNPNTILTIQYETDSLCPTTSYQNIVVRQASSYFYYSAYQICIEGADPVPTYVSNPGPDFWCNDATLIIDSITGLIDVTSMQVGNNYIIYHASSATCVDTTTDILTAIAPFDPTFNYVGSQFCENAGTAIPDTLISATGIYFSTPAGVTIQANSGVIDLNSSATGNFTITHITSPTCPDTTSINIEILPSDDSSFYYVTNSFCAYDDTVSTLPIAVTPGTYSAIPSGLNLNPNTGEIDLMTSTFGNTYTVVHITNGFCSTTDSVQVDINLCNVVIFNGFTPNGDGVNDTWSILGINNFSQNHVTIFNRWGDVVWEIENYDNVTAVWNGTGVNNEDLPVGTYYYIIDLKNGGKLNGYIELSR